MTAKPNKVEYWKGRAAAAESEARRLRAALKSVLGSACLHPDDMDGEAEAAVAAANAILDEGDK